MSQQIQGELQGWTVLVVDDEEDSLDVARRLLKKAGANVLSATNGREALELIRHHRPHCILSDLSMPEMDGWLLIQELKDSRPTEAIPVIALTAHAMPGDRLRAIEAGFHNYITKPLDARKFVQQLVVILVDFTDSVHPIAGADIVDPHHNQGVALNPIEVKTNASTSNSDS
ncbi:MAG: response regulator [Chloroflexi bacterium]|nr:response regulator [Chloroflexota bacterium]